MAWANTDDVEDITAVVVLAPTLAMAQAIIELHVDRSPAADAAATARDLYWLKQAVCWQAAWVKDQPGLTSRHLVTRVDQDGAGFEYTGEAAISLAPLAIRAIRNLSWIGGNRVLTLAPVTVAAGLAFNLESSDAQHPWNPL